MKHVISLTSFPTILCGPQENFRTWHLTLLLLYLCLNSAFSQGYSCSCTGYTFIHLLPVNCDARPNSDGLSLGFSHDPALIALPFTILPRAFSTFITFYSLPHVPWAGSIFGTWYLLCFYLGFPSILTGLSQYGFPQYNGLFPSVFSIFVVLLWHSSAHASLN